MIWREIDQRYPDTKFVLTVRQSPEAWYRSLCQMVVRRGPMVRFEQPIYGHAMPQWHRDAHVSYYFAHDQAIEDHFRGRPGKLLTLCWSEPRAPERLAVFLGRELPQAPPAHENRGSPVYGGDNTWLAQASRIAFQSYWRAKQLWRRLKGGQPR